MIRNQKKEENKENDWEKMFNKNDLNMLKKEHRLKLEIVWGNVSKGIQNCQNYVVKEDFRELVEMFVNALADFNYQEGELRRQLKENEKIREK